MAAETSKEKKSVRKAGDLQKRVKSEDSFSVKKVEQLGLGSKTYKVFWILDASKPTNGKGKNSAVYARANSKPHASSSLLPRESRTALNFPALDANSASFGSDFESAFRTNVKKARRENTRIVRTPDHGVKG